MRKLPKNTKNGPTWDAVLAFGDQSQTFAGIDEVGRGAWAGPVVAAAVILPFDAQIPDINDSKLLSPQRRREADRLIRTHALAIGIGWVHATEVDSYGLTRSILESGRRALKAMQAEFDVVLLDGNHNYLADDFYSFTMVKGDSHLPPVAAASIIAKVARDRYMEQLDRADGRHQFSLHKGYGTALHRAAIEEYGITPHHRRSYKPLQWSQNVD